MGTQTSLAGLDSGQTLQNLNAASKGGSKAAYRYALFVQKAEEEGYGQVARLFRAAAAAEAIHRETHKKVILELGGALETFKREKVEVSTTAENQSAIEGESYERDRTYSEFLEVAKADDTCAAIRGYRCSWDGKGSRQALRGGTKNNSVKIPPRIIMSVRCVG